MKFGQIVLTMAFATAVTTAVAEIPAGYYDACEGKKREALKSQLYTITSSHKRIPYGSDGTWGAFHDTDVRSDNTWWDIYTDTRTPVTGGVGSGMNIEHTFPKSWWGGDKNDAYCDIVHLMPVTSTVNSRRGNMPYAEVDNERWSNERCKTGSPKSGQGGGASLVFEPDDEYKGDLARTYFYMVTCYQNLSWQSEGLKTAKTGSYPTLQPWAIDMLLEWHRNDPVSDKEIDRNEGVYENQRNRNPYIDHPEMVEYIWGNKQSEAWHSGATPDPDPDPNPDPDEPGVGPELTSPIEGTVYTTEPVETGLTTTIEIPLLGTGFTHTATVKIEGEDSDMFNILVGNSRLKGMSITAADVNRESGYMITIEYAPTEITAGNSCHTITLTISSQDLETPVAVYVQATSHAAVTLTPIVALEATEITDDTYTANWIASLDEIDYYTLYRNIWDEDGSEIVLTETYEIEPDETSFAITDRMADCKETYTVTSTKFGIESEQSNTITVASTVSVDSIELGTNAQKQYFTPDGIQLNSAPQQEGVYMVREGESVRKIIILHR